MTTVKRDVFINASPDDVAAIINDPHRLPEWYAGVESVEPDDVFPEVGGQVELVYKAAGTTFTITQTALEHISGELGVIRMEGMIAGTNRWDLAPEGSGTRVTSTFDYEMPGGALGKIADKLIVERMNTKNLEDSLKNLKALVEG